MHACQTEVYRNSPTFLSIQGDELLLCFAVSDNCLDGLLLHQG